MQPPNVLGWMVPLFAALLAFTLGASTLRSFILERELSRERAHFAVRTAALATEIESSKSRIHALEASTTALEGVLVRTQNALLAKEEENTDLAERLGIAADDNASLQKSINGINEKIGILDKLTKADKQLLQKYSKVYFLNENYVPASLATVTPEFAFDKQKTLFVHTEVKPHLDALMSNAASSSAALLLVSAYRSFKDQETLKSAYTVSFGSGANKFSADQGYSEHQLGTTVDFTTPALGRNFTKFDTSEAYRWLTQNAFRYGFVLSYPKGNAYYIYEPWHWRYVGIVLAAQLHQEGKYFYDLDQRKIDGYLIDLF